MTLVDSSYGSARPGATCTGERGYDDVHRGAEVVLSDEAGKVLAASSLSSGSFDGMGCVFEFSLSSVPRSRFYRLSVAGQQRGELHYSYADLEHEDWSVSLSLGDD